MADTEAVMEDVNKEIVADLAAEDTAAPESSPEEPKVEAEPTEEATETEGEKESEEAEEPTEEEAKAEETEEAPKAKSAEGRKEALNLEIRQLVSQREALRNEVAQVNAQVYAPQTAEELVAQGEDPAMARVAALEQRTQMAEFNAHVADLNANLNTEALQVMHDFPVFDPQSPEFDASLSTRAKQVFEQAAATQVDPQTGLIVQSNVLPYNIYKAFAETHNAGAQNGQVSGQKAAEKMLAAAEPSSSSAPKAEKEDAFMKGLMPTAN